MTRAADTSFLAGANGAFVEELYARFASDPASVDPEWAAFFSDLRDEAPEVLKALEGASWAPRETRVIDNGPGDAAANGGAVARAIPSAGDGIDLRDATRDSIQALTLIRSHRVRGHLYCDLDPLKLEKPAPHSELDPESYGFTEADYDRPILREHARFRARDPPPDRRCAPQNLLRHRRRRIHAHHLRRGEDLDPGPH